MAKLTSLRSFICKARPRGVLWSASGMRQFSDINPSQQMRPGMKDMHAGKTKASKHGNMKGQKQSEKEHHHSHDAGAHIHEQSHGSLRGQRKGSMQGHRKGHKHNPDRPGNKLGKQQGMKGSMRTKAGPKASHPDVMHALLKLAARSMQNLD